MALFSGFSAFLEKAVGNNMANEGNDVFAVKESLQDIGRMILCL